MPRVRPKDFRQLDAPRWEPGHPWARWWRHCDGTVSHVHYRPDGSVIGVWRHDRPDSFPGVEASS